jgi:hypothetical protein
MQMCRHHQQLLPNILIVSLTVQKITPEIRIIKENLNHLQHMMVHGEAHIGTHVEQASWLRFSVPTLDTSVINHEESERSFIQCEPFSKQRSH